MENIPGNTSVITINNSNSLPIYKQIMQSVRESISSGKLKLGDMLPSVNSIAADFSIARGSIFKAFGELRNAGIIDSIPGKGYFVTKSSLPADKNIFLLMSTFNPYREILYNAFVKQIKGSATVDIYFHHHNIKVFETLISNHAAHYNTFVIMPEIHKQTERILMQLDQKKLYLLDAGMKDFGAKYPFVCQNYEKDIYNLLKTHIIRIEKYKRVVLLFSSNSRSYEIITGFESFVKEYKLSTEVVRDTENFKFRKHDLYITTDDNDLVRLIQKSKSNNWSLGRDIGVVSYNETPLKSVIAEGITTITSDFVKMGTDMANMIIKNKRESLENPFLIIDRNSF
ncbi:GntR family transcriptional regulator [Pedobacter nyackensis]|uniref:Transcriptional regulator, GntR family n=1 Tax=Pedobacter nyackensis TaxID=475255 RepID=A0A1W2D449_9SPHI|nr:GntR family transcriptional regulator [Pedobacter nyackensis]SMC91838.1 transcriptional regulator, GntR family [Pedobacter nyackensis]